MTDKEKRSIKNMRQLGLTYNAISEYIGLSPNTVKSFCHRENITVNCSANDKNHNNCKNCGKPLNHHFGSKRKLFCSDKCRSDWWNKNRQWVRYKNNDSIKCIYCGAEFNNHGNKGRKYCGRDCYIRSRYGEGLA